MSPNLQKSIKGFKGFKLWFDAMIGRLDGVHKDFIAEGLASTAADLFTEYPVFSTMKGSKTTLMKRNERERGKGKSTEKQASRYPS